MAAAAWLIQLQTLCRCHYSIISSWQRLLPPVRRLLRPSCVLFAFKLPFAINYSRFKVQLCRAWCGMPHTWLAIVINKRHRPFEVCNDPLLSLSLSLSLLPASGSFRSSNAKVIKYTFKIFALRGTLAQVCVCVCAECVCVCHNVGSRCTPTSTLKIIGRPCAC